MSSDKKNTGSVSSLHLRGVMYFMTILVVSHFFWKFTVLGDDSDLTVTFLGLNISAPFNIMATHVAKMTAGMLHFFGSKVRMSPDNVLSYENGVAVRIVWACTGLKQAYIFICIIAFYRGKWQHKLWFIPAGLVVVYLFNIIRIAAIVAIIHRHADWFYMLHEHVFKYLFYIIIFGMWVFWNEKLSVQRDLIKPEKL